MSYTTYKIIHLIGIAVIAIGIGGMLAGGSNRRTFAIFQGIGLLPFIFRKLQPPLFVSILIVLTLVGLMAWLGVMKPALW